MNLTIREAKELSELKASIKGAIAALELCDYCDRVTECRARDLGGSYLCSNCFKRMQEAGK